MAALVLSAGSLPRASEGAEGGRQTLYRTGFEEYRPDTWPQEWLTVGGQWKIAGDKNRVARQADPKLAGSAIASKTWVNYDLRATATCVGHQEPWGMGLFAYWQDPQDYYRLSSFGDQLHLVRCLGGVTEVLASAPMQVRANQPWTFRLALAGNGESARLRGRAWQTDQPEPAEWQVEAFDFSKLRRGGAAGVWCAKARCQFDEVLIEPTGPVRNPVGDGRFCANFDGGIAEQPPAGWFPLGGDWRLAGKDNLKLEQRADGAPFTFDANAFCLIAEWTNYTVSARLRCVTGRENWGFGVAGYYQNEDNHYRLYSVGETLFLARRLADSGTTLLAQLPIQFRERQDYLFKLRLQSDEGKTLLSGKAWPANQTEPTNWMIEAEDAANERFTAGAMALLAVDAACEFDDVLVAKN